MDCLFCKIANKEIESKIIYEDDEVIAFLDINPVAKGHTLLVPKKHLDNGFDKDAYKYYEKAYQVANILKETYKWDGITIVQNNYYGQDIKHFHIHIIPRYENDDLKLQA